MVGSDQVWRPRFFGKIEDAYLQFAKDWNIKRIAYAASFGTDEWEYSDKQTAICKNLVKKFDAVSVREDSGVDLCKRYLDIDSEHLLDPTMLLKKEDYIRLFENSNTPASPGTLMYYILDETPEIELLINKIAREKGLIPFRASSKVENNRAPLVERIQPSVEQWLRGFNDAKFVVTDSFHACVFSILFNKPFIAIRNFERGMSRLNSLFNMFEIGNTLTSIIYNYDLAFDVDIKLEKLRESSMLFLERSIKNTL